MSYEAIYNSLKRIENSNKHWKRIVPVLLVLLSAFYANPDNYKPRWTWRNSKALEAAVEMGMPKSHLVVWDIVALVSCPAADYCKQVCFVVFRMYWRVNVLLNHATNFLWVNRSILVNGVESTAKYISDMITPTTEIVRIHGSGDFFSKKYFEVWLAVAEMNPHILFYGYTKMLQYVKTAKPDNFRLIYSHGGKMDSLADSSVPTCYIVDLRIGWTLRDNGKTAINESLGVVVPVVCGKNGYESDDIGNICAGRSFGILLH